jgi:DNA-binding NarL/FixJ family response regulator
MIATIFFIPKQIRVAHNRKIKLRGSGMKQRQTMTVFIADDSNAVRSSLKQILNDLPKVRVVGEASQARGLAETLLGLKPDLLILDIRMPGGNSFSILKEIKTAIPSTIIMMITEYAFDLYRRKCLELGADYFFDKSMDTERLINVIGQLCPVYGHAAARY